MKLKKISIDRLILYIILGLLVVLFLGPFVWLLSSSFKTNSGIFSTQFSLIPRDDAGNLYLNFDNYKNAIDYLNLGVLFINTFIIATVNTLTNLFLNSLAGYAFARLSFKYRDQVFKIMLMSMMVPGTVMLVPNMIIINKMGLYDNLTALVLPFMMSVYNIFLMRQSFLSFSKELEEAAVMDGASIFRVFWSIALPLVKPTLVVLGITTFMWNYNNFLWPLVILNSPENNTLALGLGSLISASSTNAELYPVMLAGSVLVSLPLILIFLRFQKHIIKGINVGGVKG